MSRLGTTGGPGRALALAAERAGLTLAAVLLAGLALAVPLLVATLAWSLAPLAPRLAAVGEATVFAAPGTSAGELRTLQSRLGEAPGVAAVTALPREAALAELGRRTGLAGALANLKSNPLPDAFVVQLTGPPPAQEAAVATIRKLPRVDAVQFDGTWVRKLAAAGRAATVAGTVLGGLVLLLALVLAVAAVRRVTVPDAAERRVLDLLGAPPGLVSAGAAWLGALVLGIGAALGVALAVLVVVLAAPLVRELAAAYGGDWALAPLPWPWLAGTVAAAAAVGALVGTLRNC